MATAGQFRKTDPEPIERPFTRPRLRRRLIKGSMITIKPEIVANAFITMILIDVSNHLAIKKL
jgi:hypothetical protein